MFSKPLLQTVDEKDEEDRNDEDDSQYCSEIKPRRRECCHIIEADESFMDDEGDALLSKLISEQEEDQIV